MWSCSNVFTTNNNIYGNRCFVSLAETFLFQKNILCNYSDDQDVYWNRLQYKIFPNNFTIYCFWVWNAYYIISSSNDNGSFTEDTFWRVFIYAYNQSLGSFDTSAYTRTDQHLLFTIWWLNTMIVFIIMLNLLITIMVDTFDRVKETS